MDYDFLGLPNQPQTMDLVNMVLQMEKHFPSEFHDYPQSVIDFSSATGLPPNSQYPITATYPPGTSILQQGGAPPNSAFYPELGLGAPTGDLNNNNNEADDCSNGSTSPNSKRAASMAAMREMIFRIAAMQPVHIDPESVKAPRRRNVRISKDPQSVAARHRRERISERIRILQRLVPGGTKMDTASMLDEAIHYVKFLKDQVQTLERAATTGGPHPWLAQQQQHVMPGAGAGAGGGAYGGPQGGPGSCGSSGNSSPLSSSTSSPPHYSGGGGSSDNNNIYNHQQYVASAAGDMYNNHHHQPHHLYDEHQQYINSTTTAYMFR